jgi:hypothetical protein
MMLAISTPSGNGLVTTEGIYAALVIFAIYIVILAWNYN